MKNYYIKFDNGNWGHRHPIKIIINPVLRFIQFWTNAPYVIASKTEFNNGKPNFIKFTFTKVKMGKE